MSEYSIYLFIEKEAGMSLGPFFFVLFVQIHVYSPSIPTP
jgi:hypothetical protein